MADTLLSIPSSGIAGGTPTQSYTEYHYTYTATQAQTYLTFQFRQDPGYWALDDVTFTSSSGSQLLTNGGFESGNLTGWTLIGVQGAPAGGAVRSGSPGVGTTNSHAGHYFFRDGAIGGVDGIFQAVSTTPGQQYTIDFWLAATGNTTQSALALVQVGNTLYVTPPTNLALAPASDTGVQGDGITSVTLPVITGLGIAGASLSLYDGGTAIGTTTVANDGTWSLTSTNPLSLGAHTLTATQRVGSNTASGASSAFTLTIAAAVLSAPTLSLAPGSDTGVLGDALTSINTPGITGTGTAGATVDLYDGGSQIGTATVANDGSWSIALSTPLSDGVHQLTATATDPNGNASPASPVFALTIDSTAPAVSVALVNDTGSSAIDRVTADPTISGSGDANAIVTITEGTATLGTVTADTQGLWTFVPPGLADGAHTLAVSEIDAAGNSMTAQLGLTLDTNPPAAPSAIALAPTSDSGVPDDGTTNVIAPTLTGSAEPGSTVTLHDGPTLLGTALAGQDGTWSFAAVTLAEGVHPITATSIDLAGNISPTASAFALTIDTIAPAMTVALLHDTGPSAVDRITADPTLSGTGAVNAIVTITEGTITLGTTTTDAQGLWAFTPPGLADGAHNLVASETDIAGNTSTARLDLTLDTAAPTDNLAVSRTTVGVYRFFDMMSGAQFLTSSISEHNEIGSGRADLQLEGVQLYALNPTTAATDPDAAPVYRFFDTAYGTHFFTTSAVERDTILATQSDLRLEGTGFYEHTASQDADSAVYRFFNVANGTHFYTEDLNERATILATRPDMKDEGISFYAPKLG